MSAQHLDTKQDRDALITSHMPLVGHIVRETLSRVPQHVSRDDLMSAGLMALVQSESSFDDAHGVTFAQYAGRRIRGAVLDELRSVDWASRAVRRRARDLDATRGSMASTLGRVPTDAEVASALGLSVEDVHANAGDVERAQVTSLQALRDSSIDDLLPSDGATPEEQLVHRERLTYVVEAVAELPERLRTVILDYYFDERPMAETAAEMGVSESRVSQLRAEAVELMREAINRELEPESATTVGRPGGCVERRRTAYFTAVAERHAASMRPSVTRSL